MNNSATSIGPVARAEIAAALELLVQQAPATEAAGQRDRWAHAIEAGELDVGGLLVAHSGRRPAGAVWLQPQPGAYALLTPPELATAEPAATADALLQAALRFAEQSSVRLVQALLPPAAGSQADFLLARGFLPLAELVYLVCLSQAFPTLEPRGDWSCRRYAAGDEPALQALLERTYQGSLDCPALAGLRSAGEALAGYAAVGTSGTELWLLVESAEGLVGCLLMADHPADGPRELVYLGLVPEVRGRRWGEALGRFAQWTAGRAGKDLLVLAVDAANGPAVDAYARAGFTRWESRRVFVLDLGSGSAARP